MDDFEHRICRAGHVPFYIFRFFKAKVSQQFHFFNASNRNLSTAVKLVLMALTARSTEKKFVNGF